MEPHELVKALFERRDDIRSVSELARLIHNQGFQGTLHKFLSGRTRSPDHDTATRIAKFFGLPIEAIYDSKAATRIGREMGLALDPAEKPAVASQGTSYSAAAPRWPFKQVTAAEVAKLSPTALRQLERLIVAFLGGPVPAEQDTDSWRSVAQKLAGSMDRAIGKDVYSSFVVKVDELMQPSSAPASAKSRALAN